MSIRPVYITCMYSICVRFALYICSLALLLEAYRRLSSNVSAGSAGSTTVPSRSSSKESQRPFVVRSRSLVLAGASSLG